MTLMVEEMGDLEEEADLLVDRMFNMLVRELRDCYGTSVPSDDRLADIENRVRNFIWKHVPKARFDYPGRK